MRTGTIVYLTGAGSLPDDFDPDRALAEAGLPPDWTELAASSPGFYRPDEALLALAARGAGRVELARANFDPQEGLVVQGARIHLRG